MNNKDFDIIILATKKNLSTLEIMLPYCKKNLPAKHIYIVSNRGIKADIERLPEAEFVDEESVLDGLNIDKIFDIIEERCGQRKRAGWYLQQFLKMAWCNRCLDSSYIVIDADTFPLNPIEYLDVEGKYLFTSKIEYNKPYFDTIETLFNGDVRKCGPFSFVAENMIFDTAIMKEMIERIEANTKLKGKFFYEKIMYAINVDDLLRSGFSEFETYGNFLMTYYPSKAALRKLRTNREAAYILGELPTAEQLKWAEHSYDIISVEASVENTIHKKSIMKTITSWSITRSVFSMKTLSNMRSFVRSVYRKALGREDFKFE